MRRDPEAGPFFIGLGAVSLVVYSHPKPQIPPLRCGMTNKP